MERRARRQDWIGVRWGLPCSALFHAAIIALVLFALPEPRKPRALPKEIPVEVVRKAPEKKPVSKPKQQARKPAPKPKAKKPEAKKPVEKQALAKPQKPLAKEPDPIEKPALPPEKKVAEKKPPPMEKPALPPEEKPAQKKPPLPEKPALPPEKKVAEKKPPILKKEKPAPEPMPLPKSLRKRPEITEPIEKLPPVARLQPERPIPAPPLTADGHPAEKKTDVPALRPKPAPPPKPKIAALKLPPQVGALPRTKTKPKKLLGRWVLQPVTFNIPNECGTRRITGTMNLIGQRTTEDGRAVLYQAVIRTTNHWERCPPRETEYRGFLVVVGNRVYFADRVGSSSPGYVSEKVISLRGGLGQSIWRRR
jgi:hypothetical protein